MHVLLINCNIYLYSMSEVITKGIYINDSLHGLIRLSEFEKEIVSSVGFNRLHDIYQNSTVYLTYPSNRTKRFEHSIGTMKLCSDMFYSSVSNSSDQILKEFYSSFKSEINILIKEIKDNQLAEYESVLKKAPDGIPNVTMDCFRKTLIPYNVPKKYIDLHIILAQSVRIAALLHDIGHPPFSHIVEFALTSAKDNYFGKHKTKHQKDFSEKMSVLSDGEHLHEMMGKSISQDILNTIIKKENRGLSDSEVFFEILVLNCVNKMFDDEGVFLHLHRIIDGTLDGDRLDYVNRDPFNSGLNIGSIDYSRIIKEMKILYSEDLKSKDRIPVFCIPVKAINSVEDFLHRRYDLYKNIITHHRVIKTDFLLENIVKNLIAQYLDEQPTANQEKNTNVIPFDISGLWFPLKTGAMLVEKNCALSQWNDSWLITILKQIYYKKYHEISPEKASVEFKISCQLAELLENKKSYHSLIKRSEDFKIIDDAMSDSIKDVADEIENKIRELEEKSKEITNFSNDNYIDEAGTLSVIRNLLKNCRKRNCEFVLPDLIQKKKVIQFENVENEIKEIVQKEINAFEALETYDVLTVFKTISDGLGKPLYFYDNEDKLHPLDEISGIARALKNENYFRPVFYVYVLTKESKTKIDKNKHKMLEKIGTAIGKCITEKITEIITKQLEHLNEKTA